MGLQAAVITCDGCGGPLPPTKQAPFVRVRGQAPLYACKDDCKVIVVEKLVVDTKQQIADEAAAAKAAEAAAAKKLADDKAAAESLAEKRAAAQKAASEAAKPAKS